MITIRYLDNVTALAEITSRSQRVQEALVSKINQLNTRLQSRIQLNKLMGQVLAYHTGRLFRSVEVIPAQVNGNTISGGVQAASGPAFYGRFHEEGVDHPWEIRPVDHKLLRFLGRDGRYHYAPRVMHPGLPQRSFMASTQEEMKQDFLTEIQQTIYDVLRAQPRTAKGRYAPWNT